jgi:hypothetical protein
MVGGLMSDVLEGRIRQLERELDDLRSTTQRDREQLAALTRDLSELTVALRELRTSLDTWWRDRWPSLEGRLGRIEATVEGVSQRVASPSTSTSSSSTDWRVLGLIAAAIFGGGLTVGGGAGAGLVPLIQQAPAGK